MKKVIVDMDNTDSIYHNGRYVGIITDTANPPPEAKEGGEPIDPETLCKLKASGFEVSEISALRAQGLL